MIVELILFAIAIVIAAALVIAAYQSGVEEGWRQAGAWADILEPTRPTDFDPEEVPATWHPATGIDRRSGVERRVDRATAMALESPLRRVRGRREEDRERGW